MNVCMRREKQGDWIKSLECKRAGEKRGFCRQVPVGKCRDGKCRICLTDTRDGEEEEEHTSHSLTRCEKYADSQFLPPLFSRLRSSLFLPLPVLFFNVS